MTHLDIVKKLIGNIRPLGDASRDGERFENLKEMCNLANALIKEIDDVAYDFRDSYEGTVKRASEYARDYLTKEIGIIDSGLV